MSSVLPYINIHCHHARPKQPFEITSIDTLDFNPAEARSGFYTLGTHPWFICRQDCKSALLKIAAVLDDPNLLGVGECGLDKAIDHDIAVQMEVFNSQIDLAEKSGKPLIIHCVQAYNELVQCKKNRNSHLPWIIHGFSGKPELAGQLVRRGFYLSIGKAVLQASVNTCKVLNEAPLNRLFFETDASEGSISEIYVAAANILGLDVETLQQQVLTNFQRVFLNE